MSNDNPDYNEYLKLPDDPEEAFAVLHQIKYKILEEFWSEAQGVGGWYHERRYVDTLIAFDEVHNLGILTMYRDPPRGDHDFSDFFLDFRRHVEITAQKIFMEMARRQKSGTENIVVLDENSRAAIHVLINAIREKLNTLVLPENKRDSLFNKLNLFAAEVDRNRTRTEALFALAIEAGRTAKEVGEDLKPLLQSIDRVLDLVERAEKWISMLPKWEVRRKIEGPRKQLPSPGYGVDDEIPF